MLKKRIIPCLDIKDGRTVKGVQFEGLIDAGDPVVLAQKYVADGADELVFLDITATLEKRKTLRDLVSRIAAHINIPFTVGGGINSLEDARNVIQAGADKVSLNSAAIKQPELISQIAREYGSQCVVVAIDAKNIEGEDLVFAEGGREKTNWEVSSWAVKAEALGAGEILLTAMDHDGTKEGFAIDLTNRIARRVHIPVIASGGAGSIEHFSQLFRQTQASAALAASIFHFGDINISNLKTELNNQKIPIRCL